MKLLFALMLIWLGVTIRTMCTLQQPKTQEALYNGCIRGAFYADSNYNVNIIHFYCKAYAYQ